MPTTLTAVSPLVHTLPSVILHVRVTKLPARQRHTQLQSPATPHGIGLRTRPMVAKRQIGHIRRCEKNGGWEAVTFTTTRGGGTAARQSFLLPSSETKACVLDMR